MIHTSPAPVFLRAQWRRLAMANYEVDPAVLKPHLPRGTELDTWEGRHYVSLVGFMFLHTRVKGIGIPFHRHFEEVNLRFYVRRHDPEAGWRRGVVFIKEIVPRAAITFVANTLYGEKYVTMPMRHQWLEAPGSLTVEYQWKFQGRWQHFRVNAQDKGRPLEAGEEAEFITEHYWGYARPDERTTVEYQVEHPRWNVYDVQYHDIQVDASGLYGPDFGEALQQAPWSVFLAEGSEILVRQGKKI